MERVYKKLGKTAMPRSTKRKIKREKVEKEEDEETQDMRKYLGELQPT